MLKKSKNVLLSGSTLRVYLFMVRENRPVGVREVQRTLKFKSPSTAAYHLNKLLELGLVEKVPGGNFKAIVNSDVIPLALYFIVAGQIIPKLVPYALAFTTMFIMYLFLEFPRLNLYVIFFAFTSTLILWIESLRLWFTLKKMLKP